MERKREREGRPANIVGAPEAICEFHIVERGNFDGKLKRFGESRGLRKGTEYG